MTCWHTALCPSGPAPAPAARPEQGAKSAAGRLLETSKEQTAQPLGSLSRCSVTCTAQKCCLQRCFGGNLLRSSLCPLPPFFSPGTAENRAALSSLHPPFGYLYALLRAPSRLHFFSFSCRSTS